MFLKLSHDRQRVFRFGSHSYKWLCLPPAAMSGLPPERPVSWKARAADSSSSLSVESLIRVTPALCSDDECVSERLADAVLVPVCSKRMLPIFIFRDD